jgi:hypothetical protein
MTTPRVSAVEAGTPNGRFPPTRDGRASVANRSSGDGSRLARVFSASAMLVVGAAICPTYLCGTAPLAVMPSAYQVPTKSGPPNKSPKLSAPGSGADLMLCYDASARGE